MSVSYLFLSHHKRSSREKYFTLIRAQQEKSYFLLLGVAHLINNYFLVHVTFSLKNS